MQALIEFAKAHPEIIALLWASVLWPIVSGVGNKLLDLAVPRAEAAFIAFEQVHPRAAAVAKVLRKLGFDPHALVARIRQVLNGKPPPLPVGFTVTDGDSPQASVTQRAAVPAGTVAAIAKQQSAIQLAKPKPEEDAGPKP